MRGEAAHWTATTLVVTGSSAAGAMPQMMMAVTGGAATTSMWRIGTVRIVPHSTNWGFEKSLSDDLNLDYLVFTHVMIVNIAILFAQI